MAQPKLRFPEFKNEWEKQQFGTFIMEHTEKTSDTSSYPLYSLTIEEGVVPKSERYEREFLITKEGDSYKIVPPKAFVYNPMNLRFGAVKANHEEFPVSVSGYYNIFSIKDEEVVGYWENYLTSRKMLNYYFSIATGSLIEKLRVHFSQFIKIEKPLPSIPEQRKIAEFFSAIDKKIIQQQKIVSDYEQTKKGFLQKFFNQEIRFKDENGKPYPDWEKLKFNAITIPYKVRNKQCKDLKIYSINNQEGFVPQDEQFENAGYLKDTNTSIYMIVPPNHFAYNPARINIGSIGYQNIGYDVQVSSLYEVFKTTEKCNDKFLWYYFHTELFNKMVMKYGEGGVRVYYYYDKLCETPIDLPCLEEQKKIAAFLVLMDIKIEAENKILEDWKQMKKALIQQMFV